MNFKEILTSNSWWGKFLSALIGYCIAGPIGILFGLFAGTIIVRRIIEYYTNPQWAYFREKNERVQQIFFETTFSVMGYLAKIDGKVTEQDLEMARAMMYEMHLNHEQKIQAMHLFNEGKKSHFNLTYRISELDYACQNNRDLLKLFMDIQYHVAKVDGLTTRKIQVLDRIFSQLGFMPFHKQYRFYEDFGTEEQSTDEQQEEFSQSSSSDSYYSYSKYNFTPNKSNLDHAYALIEVSPSASKQEVKHAYRRLLSRNHPDKLIAKGLPQEMIKMANEKTQKIVKAYELICTSKGW